MDITGIAKSHQVGSTVAGKVIVVEAGPAGCTASKVLDCIVCCALAFHEYRFLTLHLYTRPFSHTLVERNMRKEDLRLVAGLTKMY